MTELEGRLVVVTGANSGVGRSLTGLLLQAGARVAMVCRSEERGGAALHELKRQGHPGTAFLEIADVSDFDAVRSVADRLSGRGPIAALVNNAGVWRTKLEKSSDGYELTMATNHLGHFLLTHLLLDPLAAGGNRVINVSSEAHRRGDLGRAPLDEIVDGRAWKGGLQAYSDSKLANVLFTTGLVTRYGERGLTANSLHPGVLATRIWNKTLNPITLMMMAFKPLMKSPNVGGKAVMRLVSDPTLATRTDSYFNVEKESRAEAAGHDPDLVDRLWTLSERLTATG